VVVGYDGSEAARAALEYAALRSMGTPGGADVVVVYGYRPPADWLGTPNLQVIYESRRELGREVLATVPGAAGNRIDLVAEPPAHAIVSAARRYDAAEIVVGSRRYGRLRASLGSVSHELLHLADRPVTIVPPAAVVA
jgi:nucleotide-binding universal stress UspA family protein